jgi:hypothetical protein
MTGQVGGKAAAPLAAEGGLFDRKGNLKKRISNNEGRISNVEGRCSVHLKGMSAAKPSFEILRFDIRYSAVRFYTYALWIYPLKIEP